MLQKPHFNPCYSIETIEPGMRYVQRFVAILILVLALVSLGLTFAPIAKAEGQILPAKITLLFRRNFQL